MIGSWEVDGVGHLRLERPDKRNAINHAMVDEAIDSIGRFVDSGVSVAVLCASGPVFCAGSDLDEPWDTGETPAADRMVAALLERPILWIAAVAGPTLGAGVGLVAACPVAVAADSAWFALPE